MNSMAQQAVPKGMGQIEDLRPHFTTAVQGGRDDVPPGVDRRVGRVDEFSLEYVENTHYRPIISHLSKGVLRRTPLKTPARLRE